MQKIKSAILIIMMLLLSLACLVVLYLYSVIYINNLVVKGYEYKIDLPLFYTGIGILSWLLCVYIIYIIFDKITLFLNDSYASRVIFMIFTVFSWSCLMFSIPEGYSFAYENISESENCLTSQSKTDFIYFSLVTFTTLGYGEIQPVGFCRIIAVSEAFSGMVSVPIFLTLMISLISNVFKRNGSHSSI